MNTQYFFKEKCAQVWCTTNTPIGIKCVPDSDDIYIRSFKARYTRRDDMAYRMKLAAEHGSGNRRILSLYPDSVKTQTSRSYSRKSTSTEEEEVIVCIRENP